MDNELPILDPCDYDRLFTTLPDVPEDHRIWPSENMLQEGLMKIKRFQTSEGIPFDIAVFTKKGHEYFGKIHKEREARKNRDLSTFKPKLIHKRIMELFGKKAKGRANVLFDGRPETIAKELKLPIALVKKGIDDLYYYGLIDYKAE